MDDLFKSGQIPNSHPVDKLSTVSSGQNRPDEIEDGGRIYTRASHPLLFRVIDALIDNPELEDKPLRAIGAQLEVSKSWCAVARRYYQNEYSQ